MQLIFIVGAARSGTTLLQSMFHSHPEVTSLPEVKFFSRYVVSQIRGLRRQDEPLSKILEELKADKYISWLNLDIHHAMEPFLSGECKFTFRDFYLSLLQLHVQRMGKSIVAEKDADNIQYMRELHTAYPDAHIVHIVRDPRDVLLSRRKTDWGETQSVFLHLSKIRNALSTVCSYGPRLFGKQYCEVRYEDLIEDPERELRKLCEWLQLIFSPDMLRYYEQATQLIPSEEMPWKRNVLQPMNGVNSQKWWCGLSRWQILAIEGSCQFVFSRFGYEPSGIGSAAERHLALLLVELYSAALRLKRSTAQLLRLIGLV